MEFTEKEKKELFYEAVRILEELGDENTYRLMDASPSLAYELDDLLSKMQSKGWA